LPVTKGVPSVPLPPAAFAASPLPRRALLVRGLTLTVMLLGHGLAARPARADGNSGDGGGDDDNSGHCGDGDDGDDNSGHGGDGDDGDDNSGHGGDGGDGDDGDDNSGHGGDGGDGDDNSGHGDDGPGDDNGGDGGDRSGQRIGNDRPIADITLLYSDGWVERIVNGRYELIDQLNRQVIARTATQQDFLRMAARR